MKELSVPESAEIAVNGHLALRNVGNVQVSLLKTVLGHQFLSLSHGGFGLGLRRTRGQCKTFADFVVNRLRNDFCVGCHGLPLTSSWR